MGLCLHSDKEIVDAPRNWKINKFLIVICKTEVRKPRTDHAKKQFGLSFHLSVQSFKGRPGSFPQMDYLLLTTFDQGNETL